MKDKNNRNDGQNSFGGYIHIYCGDGKGKTSAALGLAVRAAGWEKKVMIVRFLKHDRSGEVPILGRIPGIHLMPCDKNFGFFHQMTEEQKKEAEDYYQQMFRRAWKETVEEKYDLLILDEIMAALRYRLILEEEVIRSLNERPSFLEVAMTGRDPSPRLLELADYVSEIRKRKHPYDRGIGARKGIEY